MFDNKGRFIIENYNKQTTFSSFLPGISGIMGIPIWCFYVNRGQAVTSFGTEDKNHSIMEFYPAHQAYQLTKTFGFRTFLKVNGIYYEPFRSDDAVTRMYIGMNELEIEEVNRELGIQVNVLYYTLPNENVGGLVRSVTIQNIKETEISIEVVDGMPAIIPYGIELQSLKEMAQTMKAWMQVEDVESKIPYYRVRYSTKDSTVVSKIEEGNYLLAMTSEGERLPVIVDPEVIFEYDTAFQMPVGFLKAEVNALQGKRQITQNNVPCGFLSYIKKLGVRGSSTTYTVIGQAANKELLQEFANRCTKNEFFAEKQEQAIELTKKLSDRIDVKTSSPVFDAYCRQTYIDNVLRGGYPLRIGEDTIFYLYSRKHGDIERDYNFFHMLPEYYSQGNGNFRDVNQNRRSDVLFSPYVRDYNIKLFYNLIQLDGYNPLSVKQVTFKINDVQKIILHIEDEQKDLVIQYFREEILPGNFLTFLEKNNIKLSISRDKLLEAVLNNSTQQLNADFNEGYWVDHWTYNLDLIESYLSIYPEDEKRLLFEDCTYTYYEAKAIVLPRSKRYLETPNGVRQYHCVDEMIKEQVKHKQARKNNGLGDVYHSNLITKLMVITTNKFASLDMFGMGIEMEAGKPGWYDAINGLPGVFGSSMVETYELLRLLNFLIAKLEKYKCDVIVPSELYEFITGAQQVLVQHQEYSKDKMYVWDELNNLKEIYREKITFGIDGREEIISYNQSTDTLESFRIYIEDGIKRACETEGVCPTYFAYELKDYELIDDKIIPHNFSQIHLPLFLEGPVHYLKLPISLEEKKQLYHKVKTSELYDEKLKMYKVNASLEEASYEIGRTKAFSPGWLENESIWLHMEYKYLLELLKSGLYDKFFRDFHTACIPFLDYETYGRSPLENSSFLASSANSDEKIHGKGFVARLSGATAEFLQLWQIMMFGNEPFKMVEEELILQFQPAIPAYLICDDLTLEATFLGQIKVIYQFNKKDDIIPNKYQIKKIKVKYKESKEEEFEQMIKGEAVQKIRNELASTIVCEVII
jgi:hypothetical protein